MDEGIVVEYIRCEARGAIEIRPDVLWVSAKPQNQVSRMQIRRAASVSVQTPSSPRGRMLTHRGSVSVTVIDSKISDLWHSQINCFD
jgi:hypothetical protein